MKINLSTASPDTLGRETLLLGFFSDERPPKGFCGLVDWRLNGAISEEIASGRLKGTFLEKTAYAFPRRLLVKRLILIGMGEIADLTADRLYNAAFEMARTAAGLEARDLAIPLPGVGRARLPVPAMAEAFFTGLYDGCGSLPSLLQELDLEVPGKKEHKEGLRQGLELFRKRIGLAGIRIEEEPEDQAGAGQEADRS